jgi:predicted Rossmann-fold nucleotide-binding protein
VSAITVFGGSYFNAEDTVAYDSDAYFGREASTQRSIIVTGCDSWILYE